MANAVIGALRVTLGLDSAAFDKGVKTATGKLGDVGRQFQQVGSRLSTYISAPLSLAGAAVTAAVTTMARDIETLQRSAQVANAGFEQFQRLAFAARSVNIESEKLADIYKDVNDRIGDFIQTGGGPMADFFENIAPKVGVTAEQFARLSGPEALQLFYDSLEQANLSQADMTFYLEAMASDATALIPLLRDGGAAFREMGEGAAVLSEQDASGLKRYNDSVRQLGESFKSLTIALVNTGVLETLSSLMAGVTSFAQTLSQTNPEIVKWSAILAAAAAAIGPVAIGIGVLVTALAAVSAPVLAFGAGIAAGTAAVIAFWPQIVKLKDGIVSLAQTVSTELQALPGKMVAIGKAIIDGLINGISSGAVRVKDAIVGIASSAYQGVKDFFGVRSPSRLMAELGGFVVEGLGQGMSNMAGDVESIASDIASTVSQAFRGLIDGSKTVKDVISDLLGKLSEMFLNQGFQALLGGGLGGGGGSGSFFGSIFGGLGKLLGFANGGSFQVGGAGGIDSQLVAFKASPNERVTVTKPGQEGGRALDIAIVSRFDADGNFKSVVESISRREAAGVTQAGIRQYDRQLSGTLSTRMNQAQARQG